MIKVDTIKGNYTILESLNFLKHGEDLWQNTGQNEEIWKYLFSGPFDKKNDFDEMLKSREQSLNMIYFASISKNKEALGAVAFLDICPKMNSIEIGGIFFGKKMQRTTISTESIFLLMRYAFEILGVSFIKWKCNSLNEPSKKAAIRFGFNFVNEIIGQSTPKGKRNTLIFELHKKNWEEEVKVNLCKLLEPSNFNCDGSQKLSLNQIKMRSQK